MESKATLVDKARSYFLSAEVRPGTDCSRVLLIDRRRVE